MTLIGKVKNNLSNGNSWFAYSGIVFGGVSVPASIELLNIPKTGLRDCWVKIQPFYGKPASTSGGSALGILVKINDEEIIKFQDYEPEHNQGAPIVFELFIPYQSKLEILSLNTSANNTQERGVNVLGWYN